MVRTLGGCVAVAICSAIHREFLNGRLSAFLSPAQITAVQKSNGFVAALPEDTRARIGLIFGDSYNRQFQIMLAFAGLNIIVTVILAFVRKKMGIFGTMPQRQEANEFTKAAESETGDAKAEKKIGDTTVTTANPSSVSHEDPKSVPVARLKDNQS
jgi:hypothetical protein